MVSRREFLAIGTSNRSHVSDPVLDDLLVRQRRVADPKARREVINQIERHLAKQQYYVQAPSSTYVGVWDNALKNYGPNIGYDYGGLTGCAHGVRSGRGFLLRGRRACR